MTDSKPKGLPDVRWLLRPSAQLEAASRWYCCHERLQQEQGGTQSAGTDRQPAADGSDGQEDGIGSAEAGPPDEIDGGDKANQVLSPCPHRGSADRSEPECWKQKHAELLGKLNTYLAGTFKGTAAVIVVDWLSGYTSPHKRPTLRVEVVTSDDAPAESEAHIVKLGFDTEVSERLENELKGYQCFGNVSGDNSGPVFSNVTEGYSKGGKLYSLKYSDAEQTLRAGDAVMTLERAALDACAGQPPSLESVEATLVQLFAALDDSLYRHAWAEPEVNADYLKRRLAPGLNRWLSGGEHQHGQETRAARNDVLWALRDPDTEFVDPAMYFSESTWPKMPEMLIGTAHGDLHGRNVLVGLVEGAARWPVVFDYEDVSCCNLVAWDFVKLETELKKAALADPSILPADDDAGLVEGLYQFELQLNQQTEKCYNHNNWAPLPNDAGPLDRLTHLLLTIRRMAWKCLEVRRGRSRRWLHEYYFLLAAYGVYAARFQAYREVRPLKALFVGAGVAAYRHAFGEDLGEQRMAIRRIDALDRIAADRGRSAEDSPQGPSGEGERADEQVPPSTEPKSSSQPAAALEDQAAWTWTLEKIRRQRAELEYAKKLARSRRYGCVEEAVELLEQLKAEHPFVLELAHECAFALLELAQLTTDDPQLELWPRAERILKRAERFFRSQMHEELLSRYGRLKKDQADYQLEKGEIGRAEKLYKEAAIWYWKATKVTGTYYYPAINEATCLLLAGCAPEANRKAHTVLDRVAKDIEAIKHPDANATELIWLLATKAEAYVIAGEEGWYEDASKAYQQALDLARTEGGLQHQRSAMALQLSRILKRLDHDLAILEKEDPADRKGGVTQRREDVAKLQSQLDSSD